MPNGYDWGIAPIKRQHFEKLAPLCPVCQRAGRLSPIEIRSILKGDPNTVIEGMLVCTHPLCQSEYPIIDGIPILIVDLRTYISQNLLPILYRRDLSGSMESLLGDCFGPGSAFDAHRQHLSTYAFDHYADLDPEEPARPGSILKLLDTGLDAMGHVPEGPIIDMGCAVGRTTFALAQRSRNLVLGVDLNFGMLKTAAAILSDGRISYPKRRTGIVFDRREFPVRLENAENVDFWVCDATALPFADESFSTGVSLNVLDCVNSPYDHLKALSRVLRNDGGGLISTPYDWSANATAVEAWLGGHSQRSPEDRTADSVLRSLLAGGGHPSAIENLVLLFEENMPWELRLHDRSRMEYLVHLITVRKQSPREQSGP